MGRKRSCPERFNREDLGNNPFRHNKKEGIKHANVMANKEMDKNFGNASHRASKLFVFIIYRLKPGEDYIKIGWEEFAAKYHLGYAAFNRAVNELVRMRVIAPTMYHSVYWINENIIHK